MSSCSNFENITSSDTPVKEQGKEKHAVIISGDSDFRHPKAISFADSVLSENNYKTHIFDDTKNRDYNVTGLTTKKNLENFFDTLETEKDDLFLLYVTGHGNRDTTKNDTTSVINVAKGDPLKPSALEKYINKVDASDKVLLFTQCHSGEFGKKLGKGDNIAISTSSENKSSYGTFFGDKFFRSFDNKKADINNDKKISSFEASSYALLNDPYTPVLMDSRKEVLFSNKRGIPHFAAHFPFYNQPRINHENSNPREVYLSEND